MWQAEHSGTPFACAATLHRTGTTEIATAADAARALAPLAGKFAESLFAFGLANASLFAACILLASPGLLGVACVTWRRRAGGDPWPLWLAWLLPTIAVLVCTGALWRYASAMAAAQGSDDGSVPMAATLFGASIVGNVIAGLALVARSRRRR